MTPLRWRDCDGKEMATRHCSRCGTPVAVGHTHRLAHFCMMSRQVLEEVSFVDWRSHAKNFIVVVPHHDGERAALPILGEAA